MSQGITIKGSECVFSFGGGAVPGTRSKNRTLNNELIDTTNDTSQGWQTFAAKPGKKSLEYGVSGLTENYGLMQAFFGESQIFPVVETFIDGSTLTYDAALESLSEGMETTQGTTFEASIKSSGPVVFVAGGGEGA